MLEKAVDEGSIAFVGSIVELLVIVAYIFASEAFDDEYDDVFARKFGR